jgi:hypothetical protein
MDRPLKLSDQTGQASGSSRSRAGETSGEHGEAGAECLLRRTLKVLGLPAAADAIRYLRGCAGEPRFLADFPVAKRRSAGLVSARRRAVASEKPHSVMVTHRILIPYF